MVRWFASFSLLAVTWLAGGCATRQLTVDLEQAPAYLVSHDRRVGTWDIQVGDQETDPGAARAAAQLSARVRQSLSQPGSGFKLIGVDDVSKIESYLNKTKSRLDEIDPLELEEYLSETFQSSLPATAFFLGTLIKVQRGEVDEFRKASFRGPYKVRKAYVDIEWDVKLIELGSKEEVHRLLEYRSEAETTSSVEEALPAIDYDSLFDDCVEHLIESFEEEWVVSVKPTKVPVFLDDGMFKMFWERDQQPEFMTGYELMIAGNYGEARAVYERLVERLGPTGGVLAARALYNLGLAHELDREWDPALERYEQAMDLDRDERIRRRRDACAERKRLDLILTGTGAGGSGTP